MRLHSLIVCLVACMICLFSISNGQDFEAEKIRLSNKFSKILEYIDKYNKVKATKED